jgi:hypothetical protein
MAAIVLWACTVFTSTATARAAEIEVPKAVQADLAYILSLVQADRPTPPVFDPQRVGAVLDFVAQPQKAAAIYHAGSLNGAPSAYYEFDIQKGLREVLAVAYHPDLPGYVTSPSSVRLTRWNRIDGRRQPMPRFWQRTGELHRPLIITGEEHIVNSPDYNTGAYYDYDLDRTLILFEYAGRPVFLSLSRQKGISSVGKKGYILGSDDNWDYLYSEQPGTTKFGLGWARSYMYDSYAVIVYMDPGGPRPGTRFACFKWVKAGWSGLNFVRPSHIHRGLMRFGDVFKVILEHPQLADPEQLAPVFSDIRNLSDGQLRERVGRYLQELQQRCASENLKAPEPAKRLMSRPAYLDSLTREEMEARVGLEYVKTLLGKNSKLRLAYLRGAALAPD